MWKIYEKRKKKIKSDIVRHWEQISFSARDESEKACEPERNRGKRDGNKINHLQKGTRGVETIRGEIM